MVLISKCVFDSLERPCQSCQKRGLPCGTEEKVLGPKSGFLSPESLQFKQREGQGLLRLDSFAEKVNETQRLVQSQAVSPIPSISETSIVSQGLTENLSVPLSIQVPRSNAPPFPISQSVQNLLPFSESLPALSRDLRLQSQGYPRRVSYPEWSAACYSCIKSSREVNL